MLRVGIGFDVRGTLVILAKDVLNGIQVVLTHVAKAAAIIVPISAEGAVNAVRMVGLFGSGAEPEIVIQFRRNWLRGEIRAAAPEILFPIEAGVCAEGNFKRPAEHAGLHQFFDRFDRNGHAVEGAVETEPGVEPENAFIFRDRSDDRLAFSNRSG